MEYIRSFIDIIVAGVAMCIDKGLLVSAGLSLRIKLHQTCFASIPPRLCAIMINGRSGSLSILVLLYSAKAYWPHFVSCNMKSLEKIIGVVDKSFL